jgi:hypothetical protein
VQCVAISDVSFIKGNEKKKGKGHGRGGEGPGKGNERGR